MTPLDHSTRDSITRWVATGGFPFWEFARLVKMFTPEIFFREKINPNFGNRIALAKTTPYIRLNLIPRSSHRSSDWVTDSPEQA